MVSTDDIKSFIRRRVNKERYNHILNVAGLAVKLALHYKPAAAERIEIAALLHDCEKDSIAGVSHCVVSAETARKKFGITDKDILNAIEYHTFGNVRMNMFAKIIYVADIAEPAREYPEALQIRIAAFKNIDYAMLLAVSAKIKYVISSGKQLSLESVKLYNKLAACHDRKKMVDGRDIRKVC